MCVNKFTSPPLESKRLAAAMLCPSQDQMDHNMRSNGRGGTSKEIQTVENEIMVALFKCTNLQWWWTPEMGEGGAMVEEVEGGRREPSMEDTEDGRGHWRWRSNGDCKARYTAMANSWGIDAFYYTGYLFCLITIAQSLNTEELSTQSFEFEDEYGDIFYCVDIYKQPALDHPLLKNHKIQLRPSSIPTDFNLEVSSPNATSQLSVKKRGCPAGMVPIPQKKKGNLLSKFGTTTPTANDIVDQGPWYGAYQIKDSTYYGGSASISLYGLELGPDQCSLAAIWVANDSGKINNVVAGWTVCPETLGDSRTRFFTMWTADDYETTGCLNLECPGFVQIHKSITPGSVLEPVSTYDGQQIFLKISIYRDQNTGNWWLKLDDETIGYWPRSLFTSLGNSATTITWGGAALSLGERPPMGNGHFPNEDLDKAAIVKNIRVWKGEVAERGKIALYWAKTRIQEGWKTRKA
ncbi:hypothetical protein QJS04_geneDACA024042 [Acorus gramineus]|uniref:Neprosin PEP catalytic domain-containing protein n=1 Tax=Acorus gramineus TaxID=55184 RepID=A0AAV8ZZ74_ACOGR|nr:hypothetical protein QJS04_geneDACA024042 [Acorus gramineus]